MKKNIQKLREYARNHTTQVITKKKSNNMDEIDGKTFQKMKRRKKKKKEIWTRLVYKSYQRTNFYLV